MKLKKSDVNILLIVIGIGAALLAYFLVFTKFNDKTDAQKAANASLQQEVDRLQDLANNKQQYLDDTASMQTDIENIKAQFAAAYNPEDEVLYVRELEKNFDALASSVSMPGSIPIEVEGAQQQAAPAPDAADGTEATDEATDAAVPASTDETSTASAVMLYQTPVTIEFVASYNSIKDIVKKLNEDEMRKSIDNLTLAFDSETGDLTGTLLFNMYSLTGTDAAYTTPDIPGIVYGTNNIFNSADKKVAIEADKAAQKEADAAEADEAAKDTEKEAAKDTDKTKNK